MRVDSTIAGLDLQNTARRLPASLAMQARLVSIFCRSVAAANCFPHTLQARSQRSEPHTYTSRNLYEALGVASLCPCLPNLDTCMSRHVQLFKLNFPYLVKDSGAGCCCAHSRMTTLPSIGISEFVSYMDPTFSLRYQICATFLQPGKSYSTTGRDSKCSKAGSGFYLETNSWNGTGCGTMNICLKPWNWTYSIGVDGEMLR